MSGESWTITRLAIGVNLKPVSIMSSLVYTVPNTKAKPMRIPLNMPPCSFLPLHPYWYGERVRPKIEYITTYFFVNCE